MPPLCRPISETSHRGSWISGGGTTLEPWFSLLEHHGPSFTMDSLCLFRFCCSSQSCPMDEAPLRCQALGIQPHSGGRSCAEPSPVECWPKANGRWIGNHHLAVGGQSPAVRAQGQGYRWQEQRVQDPKALGAIQCKTLL